MGACLSSDNKGHLQVDDSVRFFISLSLEGKIWLTHFCLLTLNRSAWPIHQVHVMLAHDRKKQKANGKPVSTGYAPRATNPALEKMRNDAAKEEGEK